jgi:hypothetical protein
MAIGLNLFLFNARFLGGGSLMRLSAAAERLGTIIACFSRLLNCKRP